MPKKILKIENLGKPNQQAGGDVFVYESRKPNPCDRKKELLTRWTG
jgi:hypothetical protein